MLYITLNYVCRQIDGFLRYNRNVVESGVKHHHSTIPMLNWR